MKYETNLHRSHDCNLSVRSDRASWLTAAHIEYGVQRGRALHGIAVRQGFSRLLGAAAAPAKSICRMIAMWRDRAQGRRHLAGMDDRLLRDIGLSRLDAKREINKPFWSE